MPFYFIFIILSFYPEARNHNLTYSGQISLFCLYLDLFVYKHFSRHFTYSQQKGNKTENLQLNNVTKLKQSRIKQFLDIQTTE